MTMAWMADLNTGFHLGVLPGQENLVRAMPPGMFPGKYKGG